MLANSICAQLITLLTVVMILPTGCGQKMEGLQAAKSIKIEYRLNKEWRKLIINDSDQIREIVNTISVDHTDETARGWLLWNKVTFVLPQNEEKKVSFGKKQILDGPHSGLTYLNDTKFYDKLNEILSKKEEKKIDILQDNK